MMLASGNKPTLNCLLVITAGGHMDIHSSDDLYSGAPFLRALMLAVEEVGIKLSLARKVAQPVKTPQTLQAEVSKADVVVVEASNPDPIVFFYLGFAKALGKTLVVFRRHDGEPAEDVVRLADFRIVYEANTYGHDELYKELKSTFETILRAEELDREMVMSKGEMGGRVDWTKISDVHYENLCYELLLQRGFGDLRWLEGDEVSLLAVRFRKGAGREVALISIGGGLSDSMTVQLWMQDFEKAKPDLDSLVRAVGGRPGNEVSVKLWFVWSPQDSFFEVKPEVWKELSTQISMLARGLPIKIAGGVWHQEYIDEMVKEHPMLVRRYFTEDAEIGETAKHKTAEDLYRETAVLEKRAVDTIYNLERQYGKDPASEWQEKAYTVTHSIGNAIFPIETYVDIIEEMFEEIHNEEGAEAARRAKESIEKAKLHIRKFKTIASLKPTELQPVDILPRIRSSLHSAVSRQVEVGYFGIEEGLPKVMADADKFDELMDELVTNSIHWFEGRDEQRISVTTKIAQGDDLPERLQNRGEQRFLWVRFQDSGPGIRKELKEKIFQLFYSNRQNGMGFGLAIVRKNVRDFGGEIVETGTSGTGVQFDIFLPVAGT